MLRMTILTSLVLISFFSRPVFAQETKENQAPPQIFFIEADGKKIPIELDKPFATSALAGKASVTLRAEPYKVFPYGGLRFSYPQEFSFSMMSDGPEVSIWSLTGSNGLIMVQRYANQPNPEALRQSVIEQMTAQYQGGGGTVKQGEATLALKPTPLKGIALDVTVAGTKIRQELFSFPVGKDAFVLMLQDNPQADGKVSPDRAKVRKMLIETLKLPEK
jgi:hypothetical protein